ncbi:shugoshin 2-like [Heliangelus exortis]|uniref:shugoshin 2-like n=1 Tax=Heliangelus exortis TaxID=472823 RepID=UPI003A8E7EE7
MEASETSLFSLSGVRERMREKRNGALRTAKLNASLASKIKTKIINNSSTIKVSLKHNNKALALALNAQKANAQRLTQEKAVLQKEVEQCHFQNAALRHKLSFLNNILKKLENLMSAVKTAQLSEFHTSFVSLSNGQKSDVTEDSWDADVPDGQLERAAGMPMRVPISKLPDAGQQSATSKAVQTSSLDLQRPASNEPLETVPVVFKDTLPPQPAGKPQPHQDENGEKPTELMGAREDFMDSCIFGAEALCTTQQSPDNLPVLAWESHPLSYGGDEMAKDYFDHLSHGRVTERRKRSTLFATSTPSSAADIFPCVGSTQAAQWSTTKDSSSSSKNNVQSQLKPPCSLVSPTQTTVIPDSKSLGKEIFDDPPQDKETGCGVETANSQVPEFVPVKVKGKGSGKTGEKAAVKKVRTGKKKTNAIKNIAENGPDIPQAEESAQNAKKLLQPKSATCSSESAASGMRQKACEGGVDRKNGSCGVEQHSCSPDKVQNLRRTYVVNPPQLHSLGCDDLLQKVKKEAIFEIQSMESLPKITVCTFSSHEAPSEDPILHNSLLSKETSSACALQEDSGVSIKSVRQKINRRTRVIRQRDDSEEEYLPKKVKIQEAKAEEQLKRIQTSRKKTVRKNSCSDLRNEVDVLGSCTDVRGVAKESTKDSPSNLKKNRKTYIIGPLDLAENLSCVQTDFEGGEIVSPSSIIGRKPSKIPRVQRMVAAHSNKNQTGDLQEKGQAEVDSNMNALKKEAYSQPKPQKRNTSRPLGTDSLARQNDGSKVLTGSSAELASKQTVLTGKFSCIPDMLSKPNAFLEEQITEISLTNKLMDLSSTDLFESLSVIHSTALPVSSRVTEVPSTKSLTTERNRMPEKSSVWLESSPLFKENTADEIHGERNQTESSSQSSCSQKPEIRPLQDLTNASSLSCSSLEEVAVRSSRRRKKPVCYTEPRIGSKLRQGDPFTDTKFLYAPLYKTKRTAKANKMTIEIKEEKTAS